MRMGCCMIGRDSGAGSGCGWHGWLVVERVIVM